MKRYSKKERKIVTSPKIDSFLLALWELCKRHGLALSHEDKEGAFEVVPIKEGNKEWLMNAHDCTKE